MVQMVCRPKSMRAVARDARLFMQFRRGVWPQRVLSFRGVENRTTANRDNAPASEGDDPAAGTRPSGGRWVAKRVAAFLVGVLVLVASSAAIAAPSPQAAVEKGLDATLVLRSADADRVFLGSGFLWGDDGIAVTNAHVVGRADVVEVEYRDGTRVIARVIATDPVRDIALLQVELGGPGLLPSGSRPGIGSLVIALGAPMELGFTATTGIVAADPRQVEPNVPLLLLQHDAALNPGSSGGPLIDAEGGLLGMNSRIADGSRFYIGISYAITAEDLARLIPMMLAGTLPPVHAIGLDLRPVDAKIAAALGIEATGMLVDDVLLGGLAEEGGIRAGDILLALDGTAIRGIGDIAFLLDAASDRVVARISRAGERLDLTISLDPLDGPGVARSLGPPPAKRSASLGRMGATVDASGTITDIRAKSPAMLDGLAIGDRIVAINGVPVDPTSLADMTFDGPTVVLVERAGGTRRQHVILDPWSDYRTPRPVGGGNVLDLDVVRF